MTSSSACARRVSSVIALAASWAGPSNDLSSVERRSKRYVSNFSSPEMFNLSTSGRSSFNASFLIFSRAGSTGTSGIPGVSCCDGGVRVKGEDDGDDDGSGAGGERGSSDVVGGGVAGKGVRESVVIVGSGGGVGRSGSLALELLESELEF